MSPGFIEIQYIKEIQLNSMLSAPFCLNLCTFKALLLPWQGREIITALLREVSMSLFPTIAQNSYQHERDEELPENRPK